jgi:adenosine kinase
MDILVSGSMAYDRIMDFPGRFSDHILPDKIHILNVCFTINGLRENFGGTAGNIAYALSLLGETPTIIATGGRDFEPYAIWLDRNRIPTRYIKIITDELTAGAYITTDQSDNQITAFNPGAMKYSADFNSDSLSPTNTMAIISPGNLDDMYRFARMYKQKKIPYIFDPGQSLPGWSGEQVAEMLEGSRIFVCNDYELELTQEKTSLSIEAILKKTGVLITTKGEHGSLTRFLQGNSVESIEIPAVRPGRVSDPTGAGDAFRAGLIKGLLLPKKDISHAVRMGATCAAYSVENYGTQTFSFTRDEFNKRFSDAFGYEAY